MLYALGEWKPFLEEGVYLSPSVSVIGRVFLGAWSSVWWGSTIRGDVDEIHIASSCNIQDGSVLHVAEGFPLILGEGVTVGHQVCLHGCSVGSYSLIGIGAIILNGASIGKECLIGAGTLIPEGKKIPDRSLVVGLPARVVRQLSEEEISNLYQSAQKYKKNAAFYQTQLVKKFP